jgi:hypothetical protein
MNTLKNPKENMATTQTTYLHQLLNPWISIPVVLTTLLCLVWMVSQFRMKPDIYIFPFFLIIIVIEVLGVGSLMGGLVSMAHDKAEKTLQATENSSGASDVGTSAYSARTASSKIKSDSTKKAIYISAQTFTMRFPVSIGLLFIPAGLLLMWIVTLFVYNSNRTFDNEQLSENSSSIPGVVKLWNQFSIITAPTEKYLKKVIRLRKAREHYKWEKKILKIKKDNSYTWVLSPELDSEELRDELKYADEHVDPQKRQEYIFNSYFKAHYYDVAIKIISQIMEKCDKNSEEYKDRLYDYVHVLSQSGQDSLARIQAEKYLACFSDQFKMTRGYIKDQIELLMQEPKGLPPKSQKSGHDISTAQNKK